MKQSISPPPGNEGAIALAVQIYFVTVIPTPYMPPNLRIASCIIKFSVGDYSFSLEYIS